MQYRKRYAILFALIMCCIFGMWAVPARRITIMVTQPDGTTLELTQHGDEYFHYLVTTDGIPVIREISAYYYAHIDEEGIKSTGLLAHEIESRTPEERAFIERLSNDLEQAHATRLQQSTARRSSATKAKNEVPTQGDIYVPVLLVQYADVKLSYPKSTFENRINGENYTAEGGCGSIRDYFTDQSDGQFRPQFDIIGPITLSKNMEYYGGNDKQGTDLRPREMIKEACQKAYNENKVDFKRYDNNNDGYVDIVYVIYAGYGEASYPDMLENTIWPHQWDLESPLKLGSTGTMIDRYACNNELNGYAGTELDGIGTFCHEFSHCLGLPDFYDTSDGGTFGMSSWSIMDYGCYNDDGHTPCGYTAYEKDFLGWTSLVELNNPTIVTLKPLSKGGEGYKIINENNPKEFYVVEYSDKDGWNKNAQAEGMLVTHVDYLESAWHENIVNNDPKHPRVTIIPADGKSTSQTLTGDTYPSPFGNTELTATSNPAAKVYSGGYMNKDITNISKEGELITFRFMHGALQAPLLHEPIDILPTSFTITWDPIKDADAYDICLSILEEGLGETDILTVRVNDCRYTFEGLNTGTYLCRVRCISDGIYSLYSDPKQIRLSGSTLPSINAAPRIFMRNDSIHIEAEELTNVYYTIDGSYPTPYGIPYTKPFSITKKVTIRAIACREGYQNSPSAQFANWFASNGATYRITSTSPLRAVVSASPEGNNKDSYCGHYVFGETVRYDNMTYTLEGIDVGAFRDATTLRSVIIRGNSMHNIGDSLFHGCIALNAVVWDSPIDLPHEAFNEDDGYNNLLVYLTSATEIPTSLTRGTYATLIRDGYCNLLTLDATSSFYCPRSFTAQNVTYRRSFTQSTGVGESAGWESLVLPFDVQRITHATKGEIVPFGAEGNNHCWLATPTDGVFSESTKIRANTPYIIAIPNNNAYGEHSLAGSITFSADNALIHATPTSEKDNVHCLIAENENSRSATTLYFVPTYDFIGISPMVYALNIGNIYEGCAPGSIFVPGRYTISPFSACIIITEEEQIRPFYRISVASRNNKNTDDDNSDTPQKFTVMSKNGYLYITSSEERTAILYDFTGRKLHTIACKSGETEVGPLDEGIYILEGTKVYVER